MTYLSARARRRVCRAALWGFVFGPFVVGAQPSPPDEIIRRPLARDSVIDGVPCARSGRAPAEFHRNQRLAGCALSRNFAVGAHEFTTSTWLDLNPQGQLWGAWLAIDTRLNGYLCLGEGYKKWSVRFHPNGTLAGCYLTRETVIDGVPCMSGSFLREIRGGGHTALQLYANAAFKRCQAAHDTTLDGRPIKKWQVVERDSATRTLRILNE